MFDENEGLAARAAAPQLQAQAQTRELRIAFTGSGSEYFRIWIVNLLLIIVTLGLYLPFAKARRIRYFYANTLVDGQALSFHGDPWRMFRGFILLVALMGTYSIAGHFSPTAGLIAFLLLCAIWPPLWRSSLRFRMGNTSWRGLRFSFHGDVGPAYAAVAPIYLPMILLVFVTYLLTPETPEAMSKAQNLWLVALGAVWPLALLAFGPLALALIKRYQHGGYAYASQRTTLAVPTRRFYGLSIKTVLVMLLPVALLGVFAAILIPALPRGTDPNALGTQVLVFGGMALVYLLIFALVSPYFAARMQNLTWNGTHSEALRFASALRYRSLAWLTLKNWLLTAITLSLYRPFAAVNTARMRLEAVSVTAEGDIEAWLAGYSAAEHDAAGEAAGDFFGIDMGL